MSNACKTEFYYTLCHHHGTPLWCKVSPPCSPHCKVTRNPTLFSFALESDIQEMESGILWKLRIQNPEFKERNRESEKGIQGVEPGIQDYFTRGKRFGQFDPCCTCFSQCSNMQSCKYVVKWRMRIAISLGHHVSAPFDVKLRFCQNIFVFVTGI